MYEFIVLFYSDVYILIIFSFNLLKINVNK